MNTSQQRIARELVVANDLGLHARAATRLSQVAAGFDAEIMLSAPQGAGRQVNCKSVLDILSLGANTGDRLALSVQGPDAPQAAEAIETLFHERFGESDDKEA
jgi:phosphotransferase system HPr (HPr) family protein